MGEREQRPSERKVACHAQNGVDVLKNSPISSDTLAISVDHSQEGALVRLQGRLGIDSSPDLRERLLGILQGQTLKVVTVVLTEVSYIDASGIATLLEAFKVARNRQTRLCFKGLQSRVVRLFEVTGLLALFEANGCKTDAPGLKVN